MQQLKTKLPDPRESSDILKQWWEVNGASWKNQVRGIMIEHRNIGHDWQFTNFQQEMLEKYCYVSRDVRKYIEDTLILPIKSIPPARLE